MRQEEEEREGGGLTAILCGMRCVVNADYSILPLPSLQTYRYSMTTASPSTPTPTPSIFLPSVSPTLHLIYFRWSSNMKLWCCWCDLWLQHPTTSVSHNSSLYPFLSPSILLFLSLSRSVFVFICLFTKRTIWYEEKMELMLLWCDCDIPPFLSVIIYHFRCFTLSLPPFPVFLSPARWFSVRRMWWELACWRDLVMLIAASHHFCPPQFSIRCYASPLLLLPVSEEHFLLRLFQNDNYDKVVLSRLVSALCISTKC